MRTPSVMRALAGLLAAAALSPAALAQGAQQNPPPKKPWYESVIFKGYIQLDSTWPQGNSIYGSVSEFRIRRARPTFIMPIDPLTRVQVQFDLSTPRANGGSSNLMVTDTFAERKVPGFGYAAFGQQVIPFGREVIEDNAAVRTPLELSYPAEVLALSERDIGVFLKSEQGADAPFNWAVALVNGQGFRSADANASKQLIGRVTAKIHPMVRLGTSYLKGHFRASGVDYDRDAQAYEMQVKPCKAATLTAEYYHAKFVDSPSAPTKQAWFSGGYVLLEGRIEKIKSVPFVRYQHTYGDLDYSSVDVGWRWDYAPAQRFTVELDMATGRDRDWLGARWQLGW